MTTFGLAGPPVVIPYTASGYEPDWCHVSAKAHALANSGRRVHGWSLWVFPDSGLMGEFHSVWEREDGVLVDVTPPKFREARVMFIPDPVTDIIDHGTVFGMPANRMATPPHFWFNGSPLAGPDWGLPKSKADFVAYCAQHSLAVADFATDPKNGG